MSFRYISEDKAEELAGVLLNTSDDAGERQNASGVSPANAAAKLENSACLEELCKAKINMDEPDSTGKTPLHTAVQFNRTACLEVLEEAGVSMVGEDSTGTTPAETAIQSNSAACFEKLLQFGVLMPSVSLS